MRQRPLSEHDRDVWRDFSRQIKPRRGRAPPAEPAAPLPVASQPAPGPLSRPVHRAAPAALVIGDRGLGLDDGSWRALSRGRLLPSRRLDLHGRTADSALADLRVFLLRASADRLRCVEVITGRGTGEQGGVLYRELPHWLNRPELRTLIVAAQHPPANVGAVRLLLRRKAGAPCASTLRVTPRSWPDAGRPNRQT